MNTNAFRKISYGLYIIASSHGERRNGQVANTLFQITSEPAVVAVSINKQNFTYELIQSSQMFTASVLAQATPLSFIGDFGFKSGRNVDKLKNVNYKIGQTGAPVILDHATAYFEVEVTKAVDAGTHVIFLGRVVAAEVLTDEPSLTYEYYQQVKRGTTPKTAPSYIAKETGGEVNMAKYECSVCGYIYDPEKGDPDGGIPPGTPFEKLPDGWVCPVCGAAKSEFKKIQG
jgi:flavin reductase (DIM6/NTAB) family NADH-FMN oxidoreductase RutF/rubredoxin